MLEEVQERTHLEQEHAAWVISKQFGSQFLYTNEDGGTSIDKRVLRKFKQLRGDEVVWDRSELSWQLCRPHQTPGSQQE
jgi:hypothetical protein